MSVWTIRYFALTEFVLAEQRLPSAQADDADEARLGRWLIEQRRHVDDAAFAVRVRRLDDAVLSWRGHRIGDTRWAQSAEELAAFIAANARMPSQSADGAERALARWQQGSGSRLVAAGAASRRLGARCWIGSCRDGTRRGESSPDPTACGQPSPTDSAQ